jgi:hypothetical protein
MFEFRSWRLYESLLKKFYDFFIETISPWRISKNVNNRKKGNSLTVSREKKENLDLFPRENSHKNLSSRFRDYMRRMV